MSIEGHARRLRRAGSQNRGLIAERLVEAVREMNREQKVAMAMVALALDLAGTRHTAPVRPAPVPAPMPTPTPEKEPARADLPVRARRFGADRIWSKTVRPGPHDVLTWEEAMRVPWIDGSAGDD